jgi:hemerythrin
MVLQWDPGLALGHADIDRQHQELFRRFGALVEAMDFGNVQGIGGLFDYLGEYVKTHFAAEERIMAETAYPGAYVHASAHARFIREYGELRMLFDAAGASPGVAVKTRVWIEDWLRAHIAGVDQALARHLIARQLLAG